MVCALYEPQPGFTSGPGSELFRLCERADVVILDWDLFGADGANILPLIENLADSSQNTVPHHIRLCVIYTTKPDLFRVANSIYERLRSSASLGAADSEGSTIVAGATRVVVFGKPNVTGRTEEGRALEVREENLAETTIAEFAKMHSGILPTYALHGLASIRKNSKRILDKFGSQMDGPFLLDRALLLPNEDAFERLPDLLSEEILAVLSDEQIAPAVLAQNATARAESLALVGDFNWKPFVSLAAENRIGAARRYLAGGKSAISGEFPPQNKVADPDPVRLHAAMGCGTTKSQDRLAELYSTRTRYLTEQGPTLCLGTVVRRKDGDQLTEDYSICLMPLCDSMRLSAATKFPFWKLELLTERADPAFVVSSTGGSFIRLLFSGKPRDRMWEATFAPTGDVVRANAEGCFPATDGRSFCWVAQLKPAHAQRIAHELGRSFSRVAVMEAEWIRR